MKFPHKPTPLELEQVYKEGFPGWIWNKQVEGEWNEFCSSLPDLYYLSPEIKDLHKTRPRALLFLARELYDPGAFADEAQTTGDCTSHGSRGARDITRAVEVMNGQPELYYKRGATEPTYGARGKRGQGMDPARAARFETEYGFLFREIYKDVNKGINLDLSRYNANIGDNWGSSGVPESVKEVCKQYNVGQAIVPKTELEALDCFAAGYACHSGQSWGTKATQTSTGINRKSGSWNHAMASGGYDLTSEFFKEPVVFVHNSWSVWNDVNPVWKANEDVYGPWIPGTIVVSLDEWIKYFFGSGSIYFYSDIKSYPINQLPQMVTGIL